MTQIKAETTNPRGKTDQSLEHERGKTDEYLDQKTEKITTEAEESIRLNRLASDEERESARAAADLEKKESRGSKVSSAAQVEDSNLRLERENSDQAQKLERENTDRVRVKERFQKRLVAEALLSGERKATDANLLDERAGIDLESEHRSGLLKSEKNSHDATKTALVTRDQFLAIVSHDLRNPLGSITMSTQLLRRDLAGKKLDIQSISRCVDIIEKNAFHMDRMINDLLDVGRMENGKLSIQLAECDIADLLQECEELFAPLALARSVSIRIQSLKAPALAQLDHDRILQVLSNLIGNALKFGGGTEIVLSAAKRGQSLEISVTDAGPGISKEMQGKIFERFSQLEKNDRRGLGLGLFISKGIVEAHGGKIRVESVPGVKTSFTLCLPSV